jgi:hypothetical protein
MMGENEERWRELCEAAAKEQDSERLLELVRQINQMLDEAATESPSEGSRGSSEENRVTE